MKITHKISMDLDRYSVPGFDAVCGDRNTRELEITLLSGGAAWEVPAEASVTVRYQKPDGTAGAYDLLPDGSSAWGISGNVINIVLAPQTLTVPGCVILTVCLTAGDREISTFQILMNVRPAVGPVPVDSGDYWYLSGSLPQPKNAAVGEVLVVESVDNRGRITALKTAGAAGLTEAQISAMEELLKLAAYTEDPAGAWERFQTAFGQNMGHTHSYAAAVTTAATCETPGVRTYTCACGDSYTETIPATGHHYKAVVTAPTCTEKGFTTYTCETCGASYTADEVAAIGHSFVNGVCANCGEADPDHETEVTLSGLSASYTGGEVEAGTDVSALTGIVVTASYSDGTSKTVTGYTLSGTIAEGENTITVSYGGMTAAFTVTGYVEGVTDYKVTNNLTNVTNSNSSTTAAGTYSATLTAVSGYTMSGAAITVTMGGVDVTADVVSGNAINITDVTGAIVITAEAAVDHRTLLYNWNFTQSAVDTVAGVEATLSGATRNSSGVAISADGESVLLGNFWNTNRTIEVDFSSFAPNINATKVLVMFGANNGFSRWANGGSWGIYCNGTWNTPDPKISDDNYFANSTLKLAVTDTGAIAVFRNGEWIMTSTQTFATANAPIHIGKVIGSSYNSPSPITVTGCRIYEGVE